MASEADTLIVAVSTLQRTIDTARERLDTINDGLESLEFQIRAFEHDAEVLYENEANLRLKTPVVSIKTYREIRVAMDDTTDTLLGLLDKRKELLAEHVLIVKTLDKQESELEMRQAELAAILEPRATVLYFPTPE